MASFRLGHRAIADHLKPEDFDLTFPLFGNVLNRKSDSAN